MASGDSGPEGSPTTKPSAHRRQAAAPPRRLVEAGEFQFGTFDGAIDAVNPLDARRPFGVPLPRWVERLRLKEWQACQLSDGRFFVLVALFDAKIMGLAQVKVFDRQSGERHLFERVVWPRSLHLASGLGRSESWYRGRGARIAFRNRLADGALALELDVAPSSSFPGIRGEVLARPAGHQPLVVAMPFAANRGMYSHKAIVPAEGELEIAGRRVRFEPASSHLLVDDHKGFYPYVMQWDWVIAAGFGRGGRRIGLNLTRNQALDPERYNENCLWVDGEAHLLPAVRFTRTGCGVGDRWDVRDRSGRVEVSFEIEAEGRVAIQALVARSDYHGPFGRLSGRVIDDAGNAVPVDGLFGMGERFWLRC